MGRDRREYLYEMSYCDIVLIIRGYRRRNILQYQLQRLQAYYAFYAMRENKDGTQPQDWLPLYIDKYRETSQFLSEDEIEDEVSLINSINNKKQQEND